MLPTGGFGLGGVTMVVSVQLHEWYPCGESGLQKEVSYTRAAVCSSYCGVCYRAVAGVCMRELVAMALTRYRQHVYMMPCGPLLLPCVFVL